MGIRRAVPDLRFEDLDEARRFYGALGFVEVMNLGWVVTLASPTNPTAQVTLQTDDAKAVVHPHLSVEVDDVDATHAAVIRLGSRIVHPLQNEDWNVRRFFVCDPAGYVVNVLSHDNEN